jgi:hypothetical protein
MSVKIEINGAMVEFATISDATKAHSAYTASVELLPAVDALTEGNSDLSQWILANRVALVALTKTDGGSAKKELAEHIAASGDVWLMANASRITIAVAKPTATEIMTKVAAGIVTLAAGNKDLADFVTANYEDIREAVKPKLNEAATAGRELYAADVRAAKEISAAHGNACRLKYAGYKAAVIDGTVEEFVKSF